MNFQHILTQTTLEQIEESLTKHMPDSSQRDFYLWGLSSQNPHQHEFLQLVGMNQIVKLSTQILQPLIQPDDWQTISHYCGLIHAYFMFELVSDDLAVGLSLLPTRDPSIEIRKDLLHSFNGAMVKRLSGVPDHSSDLLKFIQLDKVTFKV